MKKVDFDFTIGSRVYCRDGKFGKLVKVVIEPETQCVNSLVVEKGFLSKRYRVFPVSLVSIAAADEVHLLLNNDDWGSYPAYKEEEYDALPVLLPSRPLPESGAVAVQHRDPYALDGADVLMRRPDLPETAVPNPTIFTLPLVLITLFTFILAACSGVTTAPADEPPGEEVDMPAALACEELPETTAGDDAGVIVPEDAVALVSKQGGVAGVTERWTVYADGRITKDTGEEWQVPVPLVNDLVVLADDAGFYDLAPSYMPADPCCDRFTYSVTVRDCDQMHTVTAVEDTPEVPDVIWDVIDSLETLLASGSS